MARRSSSKTSTKAPAATPARRVRPYEDRLGRNAANFQPLTR